MIQGVEYSVVQTIIQGIEYRVVQLHSIGDLLICQEVANT